MQRVVLKTVAARAMRDKYALRATFAVLPFQPNRYMVVLQVARGD